MLLGGIDIRYPKSTLIQHMHIIIHTFWLYDNVTLFSWWLLVRSFTFYFLFVLFFFFFSQKRIKKHLSSRKRYRQIRQSLPTSLDKTGPIFSRVSYSGHQHGLERKARRPKTAHSPQNRAKQFWTFMIPFSFLRLANHEPLIFSYTPLLKHSLSLI